MERYPKISIWARTKARLKAPPGSTAPSLSATLYQRGLIERDSIAATVEFLSVSMERVLGIDTTQGKQ